MLSEGNEDSLQQIYLKNLYRKDGFYYYEDKEQDRLYIIHFSNNSIMKNPISEKEEEVQKNMIQAVYVSVEEGL